MDKVTISEMAERAGVSIATVSRVLNGKSVRPTYKAKVLDALKELDYAPGPIARRIKLGAVASLAMLVPDLSNNFYAAIANSAVLEARKHGRNLLVSSCDGDQRLEGAMLEQLADAPIDALLYCPVSSSEIRPDLGLLRDLPVVAFARRNVVPGHPHVYTDNIKGGYIATKYLRRLGRRQIVMLLGFWKLENGFGSPAQVLSFFGNPLFGAFSSLDRLEGHRRALEEEGIPLTEDMIQLSGYGFDSGYEAAKEVLARMIPVDAMIAPNDAVAAGVIQFLIEQHIKVPEEISVIGYDDSSIALMTSPTLTSVRQDPRRIGSAVVDIATRLIEGKEAEDVVVDVSLSIRKSTCSFAPGRSG